MIMEKFLFFVFTFLALVCPVSAVYDGGTVIDGIIQGTDPIVPLAPVDPSDPEPVEEVSQDPAALAGSDLFDGGYWFVCDCALGSDLIFYVPVDWADGQFTLSSSGAPVNMSNNTVYAFCPSFPDYTFSASRFGTFTYRSSSYNSQDLNISKISDTNIDFLDDGSKRLSDYQLKILGCSLLMFVLAVLIFKRG